MDPKKSALVVVDMQEKFKPVIHDWDETLDSVVKLIKGCQILEVPIIVTQQYTKGLGETVAEIHEVLDFQPVEKTCFSCMDSEQFKEKLNETGAKTLILCGLEAHVCVLNTALEAVEAGYEVNVAVDAVSSRKKLDNEVALERMKQSGVYLTTVEAALFQMMRDAEDPRFRQLSALVK